MEEKTKKCLIQSTNHSKQMDLNLLQFSLAVNTIIKWNHTGSQHNGSLKVSQQMMNCTHTIQEYEQEARSVLQFKRNIIRTVSTQALDPGSRCYVVHMHSSGHCEVGTQALLHLQVPSCEVRQSKRWKQNEMINSTMTTDSKKSEFSDLMTNNQIFIP